MKKYNINELLELRKDTEKKITEKSRVTQDSLTFVEENYIDYKNEKNNRTITSRKRTNLNEYTTELFSLIDKLSSIKTAIQKYNVETLLKDLNNRESLRAKISFLESIKLNIPKEKSQNRKVTRIDENRSAIEVMDVLNEPMFEVKEVEKQSDQFSAQERKLNTDIQKKNLNAEIELE